MSTPYNQPIITDINLLEDGEPREVVRTWKERLFSWNPWKRTKTVIPRIPSRQVYGLPDGTVVMHPNTFAVYQREINR